eukprot:CAMPEP_0202694246 /NCGR_PEP_ID=MMETSP1385-20130828/8151_1 /ASSEMBLY_ACC=CAM_ASM_000861 /TAXON_ID=933848 /ORGANISM="Elphidium margaritaceum" /LENGTH=297 /DNA_ID=CAMNT_0049350059 /DNA_START=33 /DNA_END=926 /DNA_ORIENTATION=-
MGNTNGNNVSGIGDASSAKQSTSPDELRNILGDRFLTNDSGDKTFETGIASQQVIALYFSASWCPPCRQFTPYLAQLYSQWKKENHKVEIVFISGDKNEQEFSTYFSQHHGKWLAVPFGAPQIAAINQRFQVRGIPTLIFLDAFGNVLDANGRNSVQSQGANAIHDILQKATAAASQPKQQAFAGKGHSLKDEAAQDNDGDADAPISMYDYVQAKELVLKDKEPTANLQIVLLNGDKKTITINLDSTVGELYGHAKWLHDPGRFILLAGFPPKELKDETTTVKEAQLNGVRVTQKKI